MCNSLADSVPLRFTKEVSVLAYSDFEKTFFNFQYGVPHKIQPSLPWSAHKLDCSKAAHAFRIDIVPDSFLAVIYLP